MNVCASVLGWSGMGPAPHSLPALAYFTFASVGIFASTPPPHASAICHIRMRSVSRAGRPPAVKHESRGIMTGAQPNNSFDHQHVCLFSSATPRSLPPSPRPHPSLLPGPCSQFGRCQPHLAIARHLLAALAPSSERPALTLEEFSFVVRLSGLMTTASLRTSSALPRSPLRALAEPDSSTVRA
ncbi:hypothetical protein Mp_1g17850 [Marchantia polymorpha subsp. ruderalis]|uniref:Uncharacterized protein n=2 Tax=Marchantia polymorpha TaxID=3197 RepID=A0AAF6ARC5_MARPO|nr:hypothetical protein MARPO_0001s0124 [Marchantia polymorpha]BBM98995.1 hypothetical protein Mp_1g17850 [Marchantia polymorpha subsp. ruderalis]|eukprot:PTQ50071.1 hypothetical protein MARPO_0001s0124 [Marchantia polymorpha]